MWSHPTISHSYEEIRNTVLDLLAGRSSGAGYELNQYQHLKLGVASVYSGGVQGHPHLTTADENLFLEVFWGLFRDGIITLGLNDSNREFPWFRLTQFGKKVAKGQQAYFFHDVASYENLIRREVPTIDEVTLLYLKEAMQAFKSDCILSASVMLGVATEHTSLLLLERIGSGSNAATYAPVNKERSILPKVNKFKQILDQHAKTLPKDLKEDLDTNFMGILSLIRTFRNESGHPTGKIVDREQAYVNLQLFVAFCKRAYALGDHLGA